MNRREKTEEIDLVQLSSWKQHNWLRHGFSTRQGGISTVYGGHSLNLGWTKEDDYANVAENRRRFTRAVAADPAFTLVTIRQVHSATTHVIRAPEEKLATSDGKAILEGDGIMTDLPNLLLAVGTADCIPVLVIDPQKKAVAAFHAGWRGTAARIVEQGILTMQETYGSRPADLLAAIGPGVGPCCYTVGEEVHTTFTTNFPYANQLFHHTAADLNLNLWEANRRQLLAAGVSEEHITVVGECTSCTRTPQNERRFFSHRAENGHAGRMLNSIGIVRR